MRPILRLTVLVLAMASVALWQSPVRADSNLGVFEGTLMSCSSCGEDAWTAAHEWHAVRMTYWLGRKAEGAGFVNVIHSDHLQDMGQVTSP
jgi:hypothetical protein